jgi:hypothetical protein
MENLTLHGKKPITVGLNSDKLESFTSSLMFWPNRDDGRNELWVKQTDGETVKHFRRTDDSLLWSKQYHTKTNFQVSNDDLLVCNDLAIRIFSVSYLTETDETPNY